MTVSYVFAALLGALLLLAPGGGALKEGEADVISCKGSESNSVSSGYYVRFGEACARNSKYTDGGGQSLTQVECAGEHWWSKGYGYISSSSGQVYVDEMCKLQGYDGVGYIWKAGDIPSEHDFRTAVLTTTPRRAKFCNKYFRYSYFQHPEYKKTPGSTPRNELGLGHMTFQCAKFPKHRAKCCQPNNAGWDGDCYSKRVEENDFTSCAAIDTEGTCDSACGRSGIVINRMKGSEGTKELTAECGNCCRQKALDKGVWRCDGKPTDPPSESPTDPPSLSPTIPPTDPPSDSPTIPPTEPPSETGPPTPPTPFPTTPPPTPPTPFPTTPPPTPPTPVPTTRPPTPPTPFPTQPQPTRPPTKPPTRPPTKPPTRPPTKPPTAAAFFPTPPPSRPPTATAFFPTPPPSRATPPPTKPPTRQPSPPPTRPPSLPPSLPPTPPPTTPEHKCAPVRAKLKKSGKMQMELYRGLNDSCECDAYCGAQVYDSEVHLKRNKGQPMYAHWYRWNIPWKKCYCFGQSKKIKIKGMNKKKRDTYPYEVGMTKNNPKDGKSKKPKK